MPRFVGLVIAAIVIVGCRNEVGPGTLSYEGVTTIISASPMMLRTVVTVRNVSDRTVMIDRNVCPTWYTAHASADRKGAALWTNPTPGTLECAAWAGPLDLAPGDYWQFETQAKLAATTPNGLEFLTLHFGVREDVALPVGQVSINNGVVTRP